jgi:uncharacterized protein (DUF433 family)
LKIGRVAAVFPASLSCETAVKSLRLREGDMSKLDTASAIDWTACELIEQVPGKVSGRPIVCGTRILPDAIVDSYDAGDPLDLIHENYPGLSLSQIQRLIEFAHAGRGQPAP